MCLPPLEKKVVIFIIGSIADISNVRGPSNWISIFVSQCANAHRSAILTDIDSIFFPLCLSFLIGIFRMDVVLFLPTAANHFSEISVGVFHWRVQLFVNSIELIMMA